MRRTVAMKPSLSPGHGSMVKTSPPVRDLVQLERAVEVSTRPRMETRMLMGIL
jgi:hypothetical protein